MLFAALLRWRTPSLDIDHLYRRHAGLVMRRARRFFPDEVEEVTHEIFLRVLEKAHTYRGEASPTTWLYQITTRHCLNRLRSNRRRATALSLYSDDPWAAPPSTDPDARLFLAQAWATLDPELALIGIYAFVDDLSHQQIADLIGVSRRTVGNRVDDLKAHLRRVAGGAIS